MHFLLFPSLAYLLYSLKEPSNHLSFCSLRKEREVESLDGKMPHRKQQLVAAFHDLQVTGRFPALYLLGQPALTRGPWET